MLDMGFEPQLLSISRYIPRARQTLFFSATWPSEVQKVAERFASNRPVRLFVGNVSVSGSEAEVGRGARVRRKGQEGGRENGWWEVTRVGEGRRCACGAIFARWPAVRTATSHLGVCKL